MYTDSEQINAHFHISEEDKGGQTVDGLRQCMWKCHPGCWPPILIDSACGKLRRTENKSAVWMINSFAKQYISMEFGRGADVQQVKRSPCGIASFCTAADSLPTGQAEAETRGSTLLIIISTANTNLHAVYLFRLYCPELAFPLASNKNIKLVQKWLKWWHIIGVFWLSWTLFLVLSSY